MSANKVPAVVVVTKRFSGGFMQDDLRLLRQFANPIPFEMDGWQPGRTGPFWGRIRHLRNALKLIRYLIKFNVPVVIFWFAYMYETPLLALVTKLLGRKVVLITGGGDAVYVPEIDWGNLKSAAHQRGFQWLLSWVDCVLPFSDSARDWICQHYQANEMQTIHPAIDVNFFTPAPEERQPKVVTCCYQYGASQIVQKGLDAVVAVARQLPHIPFVIVGTPLDAAAAQLQQQAPPNVTFLDRIPTRSGYRALLQSASVYAQISVHEGFGVSVAEAMACGAIPVVTDRYSLPEVVGDCGYVVAYGPTLVATAAQAISKAIEPDSARRQACRTRVMTLFNAHVRRRRLQAALSHLAPQAFTDAVRLELGCGSTGIPGTIGIDLRMTRQTQAVSDVRHTCFATGCADEVYSFCVLEHLDNPYELMDEVVRLLKPEGKAFLRVPNLGTFSAHLDLTHRFLADLRLWRTIMEGYFEEVVVVPVGTKYRDNRLLAGITQGMINVFEFNELAQGWTFICSKKRRQPIRSYTGWWNE